MGTNEAELVVPAYANSFRRPPTVGQFRVTSGQSECHPLILLCDSVKSSRY